ncbi:hypothetical protein MMC20_007353 [Loxospora ochrophaea]|nr:hypothetical protein [Loxospora ochrophaea]
MQNAPEYVSLLGTIQACQQQTAAFQWSASYDAIEDKIRKAIKESSEGKIYQTRNSKRCKTDACSGNFLGRLAALTSRCIPFVVFKSLLMWLSSLQNFPENQILHLRCESGISTVVLWCHHLLGLDVEVRTGDTKISFGAELSYILIEDCKPQESSASLLDAADQTKPLFDLSRSEQDPELGFERRQVAFGFGLKILKSVIESEEEVRNCIHVTVSWAILLLRSSSDHQYCNDYPVERDIFFASRRLFGFDETNDELVDPLSFSYLNPVSKITSSTKKAMDKANCPSLVASLIAFARIKDLESCRGLPLSIDGYERLRREGNYVGEYAAALEGGYTPPLSSGFRLLSFLLIGRCFSDDYIQSAVLISAWGWSIFFNSIDALDPADVSTQTMRVQLGVPSRHGVRKARIVDYPPDFGLSSAMGEVINSKNGTTFFPGTSNARRGATMIGHHGSDAFSATQIFIWDSRGRIEKIYKIGFREMQEHCMKYSLRSSCNCGAPCNDIESILKISENSEHQSIIFKDCEAPKHKYFRAWPRDEGEFLESLASSSEVVFYGRQTPASSNQTSYWPDQVKLTTKQQAHFFYVTTNPAARWLQVDGICCSIRNPINNDVRLILRGGDCCFKCAIDAGIFPPREHPRPAMVLL